MDLVGRWKVRIDGGGEIYTADFEFERSGDGESLAGEYEADGKKGRVLRIAREEGYFVAEVATRRSGMAAKGVYMFELIDGRLEGDVDFEVGTSVRSYEFQAERIGAESPAVSADEEPLVTLKQGEQSDRSQGEATFCNGVNGYRGAIDTEVWAIAPSKPLDRQGTMTTDSNNGGGESQVLMRFERVLGEADRQVPPQSRIASAKLRIVVFDPGTTVYLHRILAPWGPATTWDSIGSGLSVDNIEASTVRDGFSFGEINMDRQLVEFDVTATVQKWADGEPNLGWVFVNTGGNGWDFYSSDWMEPDLRPELRIRYETR
ncbi:hypothetical protein MalM25_07830 [Planctomycetes bacterium MalM25]|nr:hypothetical protein MalM25_07830 [Planctomycetes bacterium MalM25]